MPRVCRGGFGDGTPIWIDEDVRFCLDGGGQVVETGGGAGCIASSAMMRSAGDQERADEMLRPLRELRAKIGTRGPVAALIALNAEAFDEVERLAATDEAFRKDAERAVRMIAKLSDSLLHGADGVYDEDAHRKLATVAERLRDRVDDPALKERIGQVVDYGSLLVGRSFADAQRLFGGPWPDPDPTPTGESRFEGRFASAAIVAVGHHAAVASAFASVADFDKVTKIGSIRDMIAADAAIEAKAAAFPAGAPLDDSSAVPGGFFRPYENADIYYTKENGAHEVHGDIRAKYNALGGPAGILGLPVTDETAVPRDNGRFNHFSNDGSIYWTAKTGPMMVRGAVRSLWASQGWENGPLAYPVADEYRLAPLRGGIDHPNLAWSLFQNGEILSLGNVPAVAPAAVIANDRLRTLLRTFFDRSLKAANGDIGLEAPVDFLGASDWRYGFWRSVPRTLTHRIHGFHDNGALPDTTFEIEIGLRFSLAWTAMFTYPTSVSLIAALDGLRIHTSGLGHGTLADGLRDGIVAAFNRGFADPAHPEVPDGAVFITSLPTGVEQTGNGNINVLDLLVTADGALQILLNPLPPSIGGLRKKLAQDQVDGFLDNF